MMPADQLDYYAIPNHELPEYFREEFDMFKKTYEECNVYLEFWSIYQDYLNQVDEINAKSKESNRFDQLRFDLIAALKYMTMQTPLMHEIQQLYHENHTPNELKHLACRKAVRLYRPLIEECLHAYKIFETLPVFNVNNPDVVSAYRYMVALDHYLLQLNEFDTNPNQRNNLDREQANITWKIAGYMQKLEKVSPGILARAQATAAPVLEEESKKSGVCSCGMYALRRIPRLLEEQKVNITNVVTDMTIVAGAAILVKSGCIVS